MDARLGAPLCGGVLVKKWERVSYLYLKTELKIDQISDVLSSAIEIR